MSVEEDLEGLRDWVQDLDTELYGVKTKVQRFSNEEDGAAMKLRWEYNVLHDTVAALRHDVDMILHFLQDWTVGGGTNG